MPSRTTTSRNRTWLQEQPPRPRSSAAEICLQMVDLGLMAIVFVTPLLFGGRHPLGQLVLVGLCGLVGLAWFTRQAILSGQWNRTPLVWVLLLTLGVTVLQVVPFSAEWLEILSPRLKSILPIWTTASDATGSRGDWTTLSVAPAETRGAIALLFAYAMLFVTVTQRIQSRADVERILKWIGFSAVAAALFGIVQYLFSNGKYFWFYDYPYVSTSNEVIGSFTNRNHFAHFLVLGLGPLAGFFLSTAFSESEGSKSEHTRRFSRAGLLLFGLGAMAVVCAVFCTFSRGSAMALFAALLVLGSLYVRYGIVKLGELSICAAFVVVAVVSVLSIYGFDSVAARLDDFVSGSFEDLDEAGGRRKIWSANLAAIQSRSIVGSGAGTHRYIYPLYLTEPSHRIFTHAENSYLQVVTENGLIGAVLMLLVIGSFSYWCIYGLKHTPSNRSQVLLVAVCASFVASLVHALVDFVWFVPACMAITVLLACCAMRMYQFSIVADRRKRLAVPVHRIGSVGLSVFVLLGSGLAIQELWSPVQSISHWHKFQLAKIAHKEIRGQKMVGDRRHQPSVAESDRELTEYMISELQNVVRVDPDHSRAHLKLATQLLRLFDIEAADSQNRMTISQIRDASINSNFASSRDLQAWLSRAFGTSSKLLYSAFYHATRAVELAPLQGMGYVHLAQLSFLEGRDERVIEEYLQQANIVNPFDCDVLYAVGTHKLAAEEVESALNYWKPIFQCPTVRQYQVVNVLAGKIPAEIFLKSLQPDLLALPYLWNRYSQLGTEPDWIALENYVAAIAKSFDPKVDLEQAVTAWRLLATIQKERKRPQDALASLQYASRIQPVNFAIRYEIGVLAQELGQFELSDKQFRWCLSRQPDHGGAKKRLWELENNQLSMKQGQRVQTGTIRN